MPAKVTRTHNLRDKARLLEQEVDKSLKRGALVVVKFAKKYAPVDTGRMTRGTKAGRPRWRRGRRAISVGTNVDYAKYQELQKYFSRTRLGPKSRAKGARRPWLSPALSEHHDEVVHIMRSSIRMGLRRITRGGIV